MPNEKLLRCNLHKILSEYKNSLDFDATYILSCALNNLLDTPEEKLEEKYGKSLLESLAKFDGSVVE